MQPCLFCRIAAGSIPSHSIYDDPRFLAFLDINPLTRGHALVIPKQHSVRMDDMESTIVGAMFRVVHRLLPAIHSAVGSTDSLVAVHNGPDAGQEVAHVHVHIVPRTPADGGGPVHALFDGRASSHGLAELADSVRAAITP